MSSSWGGSWGRSWGGSWGAVGGSFIYIDEAIRRAVNAGFIVVQPIQKQFSSTVPYDYVISQTPAEGAPVAVGTPVHLVVSLGPATVVPPVVVPNVVGLEFQDAQQTLALANLSTTRPIYANSTLVAQTKVISQSPIAGAAVDPRTTVTLTVSIGPVVTWYQGSPITVPDMH